MISYALKRRLDAIDQSLAAISSQVAAVLKVGKKLMGLAQDLKDALKEIDDDTNLVAARIDALTAQIKNGMTDAEVTAVKAALTAERDHLVALAKDPNQPVPVPPTP